MQLLPTNEVFFFFFLTQVSVQEDEESVCACVICTNQDPQGAKDQPIGVAVRVE
jgi:hypothetical protein